MAGSLQSLLGCLVSVAQICLSSWPSPAPAGESAWSPAWTHGAAPAPAPPQIPAAAGPRTQPVAQKCPQGETSLCPGAACWCWPSQEQNRCWGQLGIFTTAVSAVQKKPQNQTNAACSCISAQDSLSRHPDVPRGERGVPSGSLGCLQNWRSAVQTPLPTALGASGSKSCLPSVVQPPSMQTKPWVGFLPSNDLGLFFLYLSWLMEQDLCSERKPAPVGIQGGCLRCMGGILPCPGKQRAAARRRARLRGGAPSPAVPALALLQDAAVGFSASGDLLPLHACTPGPPSSPWGDSLQLPRKHPPRLLYSAAALACSPAALLCPPSYLRGVF